MEELRKGFLGLVYESYNQRVESYSNTEHISPCLTLPLSYIEFTREETNLLRLLFINHTDLNIAEPKDFYMGTDNGERERVFSGMIGIEPERAETIFIDLFLHPHGIAAPAVTQRITLGRSHIEKVVANILTALIGQEKPD